MKKLLAMLMAIALVLTSVAALASDVEEAAAAASPAVAGPEATFPEGVTGGVFAPADGEDASEEAKQLQQLLDQIGQSDLEEVFKSAGDGYGEYELVELIGLTITDYDEEKGDVTLNIKFDSAFDKEMELATLVGIINEADYTVTWSSASYEAAEDTSLDITLTAEQVKDVMENLGVLAVLKKK